jgi:hypothetical protein
MYDFRCTIYRLISLTECDDAVNKSKIVNLKS